ncbi:hypothetical protein ZWY2020_059008 [Hordeum vulgare]|nr:hypothetical protein ZWY2020_059008 [Hordeum vulgare]
MRDTDAPDPSVPVTAAGPGLTIPVPVRTLSALRLRFDSSTPLTRTHALPPPFRYTGASLISSEDLDLSSIPSRSHPSLLCLCLCLLYRVRAGRSSGGRPTRRPRPPARPPPEGARSPAPSSSRPAPGIGISRLAPPAPPRHPAQTLAAARGGSRRGSRIQRYRTLFMLGG